MLVVCYSFGSFKMNLVSSSPLVSDDIWDFCYAQQSKYMRLSIQYNATKTKPK